MSSGVAAHIPNRRLFKPFVSPSRSKAGDGARPSALKRVFSVRKTIGAIGSPLKRRKVSEDGSDEKSDEKSDEACLPGVNYNGMSKKLFKPFRPPTVRRVGGDQSGEEKSDDRSESSPARLNIRGSLG
ncbi:hypothetical protein LPJ70_006571, partial [Coemansia sp. RSA 2708]